MRVLLTVFISVFAFFADAEEKLDWQTAMGVLKREKTEVCDYLYDAAGGYVELKGEKAFNTGVTFFADVCLFTDEPYRGFAPIPSKLTLV